jgi:hypothetical protein
MTLIIVALGLYLALLGYLKVGKSMGHDEPFSLLGHIYVLFCFFVIAVVIAGAIEKSLN